MSSERKLDKTVMAAIEAHLKSRSMLFLEAAISALLEVYTLEEVIAILEKQAANFKEFG